MCSRLIVEVCVAGLSPVQAGRRLVPRCVEHGERRRTRPGALIEHVSRLSLPAVASRQNTAKAITAVRSPDASVSVRQIPPDLHVLLLGRTRVPETNRFHAQINLFFSPHFSPHCKLLAFVPSRLARYTTMSLKVTVVGRIIT